MPEDNEDMEQEEQELSEPVTTPPMITPVAIPAIPETEPAQPPGWDWVGSPSRSEAQKESDGISDLFRVTDEDLGASEEDLSDLTDVDIERDILDADEDGSLDDLVSVTEEDIMGDEIGQRPSKPPSQQHKIRRRILPRYIPPTSMGRSG